MSMHDYAHVYGTRLLLVKQYMKVVQAGVSWRLPCLALEFLPAARLVRLLWPPARLRSLGSLLQIPAIMVALTLSWPSKRPIKAIGQEMDYCTS